jgi:predicted DNA binding CopG/RHH family protein
MKKYELSEEEEEILQAFNENRISRLKPEKLEFEKKVAREAAKNFRKKSERINIRLTTFDLQHLKDMAAKEGMPYQTLISSVLHKYAAGHLKAL